MPCATRWGRLGISRPFVREDAPKQGGSFHYAWVITAAAFLILYSAYGVHYSFGVFLPDIEAALAPGRRAMLSLGFAIYVALYAVFSLVTGHLTDRVGPRPVLMVGGLFLGSGILLVGLSQNLLEYYLAYSLLAAPGMSAVLVPATSTVVKWFTARRGLAIGIVTTGIALGQFTMPPLSSLLIDLFGWRGTYVAYGIALMAIFAVAGMLMRRDPESSGMRPYGEVQAGAVPEGPPFKSGNVDMSPAQAVRTSAFWLFTGALFLFWLVVFVPTVHLPSFTEETLDAHKGQAALTLTAVGIGAAIARFGIGFINDLIGIRPSFLLVGVIQALGFVGLIVAAEAPNWPLVYLSAGGVGIGLGGSLVVFPVLTVGLFGRAHSSSISGMIFSVAGAASGVGVYLAGLIRQLTGSYLGAFAVGAGSTVASLPLVLLIKEPAAAPLAPAGVTMVSPVETVEGVLPKDTT